MPLVIGSLGTIIKGPYLVIKKKITYGIVDLDVSAEHRVKLKEKDKKDKYLDLARDQEKLYNMKMTVMPLVIGTLGTIIKGPYLVIKKITCWIVNFDVSAEHGVKLKEKEKKNKYLDLAREQEKLYNMNVTVIPIVICILVQSSEDWYRDWRTWK